VDRRCSPPLCRRSHPRKGSARDLNFAVAKSRRRRRRPADTRLMQPRARATVVRCRSVPPFPRRDRSSA
jgi:hypothetical protein